MIELRLQMFGTGSIGAGRTDHGGSKSTSKQAVSNNAPGSGRGSGGNKQAVGSQSKKADISSFTEKNGSVKRVEDGYKYNVYKIIDGKEELFDYNWSANDTRDFLEGMKYNSERGTFAETHRVHYRVKVAKTKTKKR